MEVLFCFDRRYEQHFGVAVTSLLLNNLNQVSRIHIITDRASKTLKPKLDLLEKNYSIEFCIYEVETEKFENLRLSSHWSIATYFRLLVTDILPVDLDKVLYLDSDLVVDKSLSELFNLDLAEYPLAAWGHHVVSNKKRLGLKNDYYFNAGVILINLAVWRRDQIAQNAFQFAKEHPEIVKCHDQDALNKIVDGNFLHLPQKWNSLVDLYAERSQVTQDSAIIHFVGSLKPWQIWCLNPDKEIYWKYLKQSPWSTVSPMFPRSFKQTLSAGRYIWNCIRKSKIPNSSL
jgi:lipopolysaccharide biosynthesis glycosyltransferase